MSTVVALLPRYTVVAHMHILVTRAPMLFAEDHKHFYCRFNDPTYIKVLKLEVRPESWPRVWETEAIGCENRTPRPTASVTVLLIGSSGE